MTVAVAALCGVVVWTAVAFPVALVIGRAIRHEPGEDGPDGTAGDLLADQPPEVLTDLGAEFLHLVAPLEAERDARLRGRVIWP